MQFEYDHEKSASNKEKHGIDFEEAQALWDDVDRIELPASYRDEPRFFVIGVALGKVWTSVITYRGSNTRIISVRRAREDEVRRYYEDD